MEQLNGGIQNRNSLANEFGRLSDKAAGLITIQLIQEIKTEEDQQIYVSKIMFIDMPGSEVLVNDPETLRIKQGRTLNQSILALQSIVNDLSTGNVKKYFINPFQRDAVLYDSSKLTSMCKDIFGGNAVTVALFHLQSEDQAGSAVTLKFIKQCQQLVNFPIINDNRSICLLRKYRIELNNLRISCMIFIGLFFSGGIRWRNRRKISAYDR